MNRKTLLIILLLGAAAIAALLVADRTASPSLVGRWHQLGGTGEQMTFTGGGEMEVNDTMGSYSWIDPGSYTWIDAEHLRIEFAMGSPRLIYFSPVTGDMVWTNHNGSVVRYTKEPGSSAKVRISKALGF